MADEKAKSEEKATAAKAEDKPKAGRPFEDERFM